LESTCVTWRDLQMEKSAIVLYNKTMNIIITIYLSKRNIIYYYNDGSLQ